MNLKESFRYKTYLSSLAGTASLYIRDLDHAFETTQLHMRSKVNPDAEDESEIVEVDRPHKVTDVIAFLSCIVDETEALCIAINKAKARCDIDIDAMIESNKARRNMCDALTWVTKQKCTPKKSRAYSYKFNESGDQVTYYYDTQITTQPLFEPADVKAVLATSRKRAEELSRKVELALITTEVGIEPKFDMVESFDEAVERFVAER